MRTLPDLLIVAPRAGDKWEWVCSFLTLDGAPAELGGSPWVVWRVPKERWLADRVVGLAADVVAVWSDLDAGGALFRVALPPKTVVFRRWMWRRSSARCSRWGRFQWTR